MDGSLRRRSDNTPATTKKQTAILVLVCLLTLLSALPMDVMLPSYPDLANYFKISTSQIPVFLTAFAIGFSLSQIVVGPLSDQYGRKLILLAGLLISLVGVSGCLFSSSPTSFTIFRLIQGIGCGALVVSQALIQDNFAAAQRQHIRIFMVTFAGICISISPLCGVLLQQLWKWQGSFYVTIVLTFCIFSLTLSTLDIHEGIAPQLKPNTVKNVAKKYHRISKNKSFVFYFLISSLAFTAHFSFIAISPLIFIDELGMSNVDFSFVLLGYGGAYIVSGVLASRLAKILTIDKQIQLGIGITALAALCMMIVLASFLSKLAVIFPMILCTFGTTMIRPASVSRAMDNFSDSSGTAAAAGGTLTFILAGLVSAVLPLFPVSPSWSIACYTLVAAVFSLVLNIKVSKIQTQVESLIEAA